MTVIGMDVNNRIGVHNLPRTQAPRKGSRDRGCCAKAQGKTQLFLHSALCVLALPVIPCEAPRYESGPQLIVACQQAPKISQQSKLCKAIQCYESVNVPVNMWLSSTVCFGMNKAAINLHAFFSGCQELFCMFPQCLWLVIRPSTDHSMKACKLTLQYSGC